MTQDDNERPSNGAGRQPDLIGYTVTDRGEGKEPAWNRVGAAWAHRDGKGLELHLDAVPVDGRVTLRELKRGAFKEERRAQDDQAQTRERSR